MNIERFLFCCACVATLACGDDTGANGACTVTKTDAGTSAVIECPDGTRAVIEAPSAADSTCKVSTDSAGKKTIKCGDGSSIELSDGQDGEKGEKGDQGDPGEPGSAGPEGPSGGEGESGGEGRSALIAAEGLTIEISEVTIPEDRKPVAKLTIRDGAGHALDRTGAFTPGAVSASFMLAYLSSADGTVGEYVPYNMATVNGATIGSTAPALANAMQPRAENNGTWTELEASTGTYSYKFNQTLPENYDKTKTHTVAVYASRTYSGTAYVSNPIKHWRPDGQDVTETREVVATQACNKCHNTLREHGGSRREIGLCITCHVKGTADPESGNSLELSEMIHKIHSGKSLPSVVAGTPYQIVGFNSTVHDYSEVTFPQALQNCATCHQGEDGNHWKTALNRAACSGCHDRVSYLSSPPSGYTLHTGGQQTTDTLCANCHAEGMGPIATLETDIVKVHKRRDELPLRDTGGQVVSEAPTLTGTIVGVTGSGPSDSPQVRFTVALNGAPYDILGSGNALSRLRFTFAGPTTDYTGYVQYTAQGSGAVGTLAAGTTAGEFTWTVADGVTMTTIATACGTEPAGSFAVGMEGRLTRMASLPNNTQVSVNYAMHNNVAYFAVTDPEAVPRRVAVVVENCNNCHEDLAAHGGSRNDPEYCVLCHNANNNSTNVPAPSVGATKLTSTVRMSYMVHRIHAGETGANPYVVANEDFGEVVFPGELRNCTNCHVPSHYELPLPPLLPTRLRLIDSTRMQVPMSDFYFMQATGSACTGCHDSDDSIAHVEAMTTSTGKESCAVCHGTGTTHDVDVVHATPGL